MGFFKKKYVGQWKVRTEGNTTLVISPTGRPSRFMGKVAKPKAIALTKERFARTKLR